MTGLGRARAVAGWALYLGASWTWVIGALWPILLVRDYGIGGWLVFVVPNVLGAAAMGFVLSPEGSRELVARHAWACRRFSEATLAYHAVVLTAVLPALTGPWPALLALGCALAVAGTAAPGARQLAAALACGVSVVALAWISGRTDAYAIPTPRLGADALAAFAPGPLMGFLLCPYLDLTFHEARRATDRGTGRAAFAVGFGCVFLALMAGGLAYAGRLEGLFDPGAPLPGPGWAGAIAAHVGVQSGVTAGLHLRARGHREAPREPAPVAAWITLAVTLGAAGLVAPALREPIYRGFLLLYGLVFPAYVWLAMIPCRGASDALTRRTWAAAVAIALPFGAAAALGAGAFWTLPAVGVLGVARAVLHALARGDAGV